MSLVVPSWYFINETDNVSVPTTRAGISVTCGSSCVAAASTALLASALTHDVHCLYISIASSSSPAGLNPCAVIDVLYDPLGGTSWSTFINALMCGAGWGGFTSQPYPMTYMFPVFIPSGASLGVQGRAISTLDRVYDVACWAFGNPSRPSAWWAGTKVETLGVTATAAQATAIPVGTTGHLFGAWTNVGSVTSGRYGFVQPVYSGVYGAMQNRYGRLIIGTGNTILPGTSQWVISANTNEIGTMERCIPCWVDIPAGTQMQAAISSTSTLGDSAQVAIYGVY